MLPFLKNQKEASTSEGDDEVKRMKTSDEFSMLDAVAEDMMSAFKSGDKERLKGALEALCMHIQEQDLQQDSMEMT